LDNAVYYAWDSIKSTFWEGFDAIQAGNGWDWVKGKFSETWNNIKSNLSASDIYGNIKQTFSNAWEGVKEAWNNPEEFFSGIWSGIQGAFSNVTGWFKDVFTGAWQGVKDVFSSGGAVFAGIKEGILDTFKTIVNGLIGGINTVIAIPFEGINSALQKIKDISIFGLKPFDWMPIINTPQIPMLAKGAIIDGPTLAVIGEAGRESVIPHRNDARSRSLWEQTGRMAGFSQPSAGGRVITVPVSVDIKVQGVADSDTVARLKAAGDDIAYKVQQAVNAVLPRALAELKRSEVRTSF